MTAKLNEKKYRMNKGDPWVWVTAMGLGVGLLMVAGILGLIATKGLAVFWPKRVAAIKVIGPEGSEEVLWGEIVKERTKHAPGEESKKEIQIFQGNREVLGQAFRFIDKNQVQQLQFPPELIRLERLEYGKAFGVPVALQAENGEKIPSTDNQFFPTLQKQIDASTSRWRKIRRLEKTDIGEINAKLERIGRQLKTENVPTRANLEMEQLQLQEKYEGLAAEARQLRAAQEQSHLIYRLASGEEKSLPMGQIVAFTLPNQMNFPARLTQFWKNIGSFLTEDPREANTEGGVFPALFGTLVMTVMMSLAVVPFGVIGAIYLSEYARQGVLVRLVRIAVNNLAGVPSIVFGVFGLGFFVYLLGGSIDALFFRDKLPTPTFGTGGLFWASLTLALLTVPVVIVSTEEAFTSVSRGTREGALACGASKWQVVWRVLLPAAGPGILTGAILAMARGAGEVAPLMLVGVVKLAPTLPINGIFPYIHLDQKFMHLGFHIFDLGFQSPDSEAALPMVFATTLLLITMILVLNLGAILLREKLRKKYATGNF